jgi:hypothetical protein
MTSNMKNYAASPSIAGRNRGECPMSRTDRAREAFAGARAEVQQIVDQLVAGGIGRRELSGMPAFRAAMERASSCRVELAASRLIAL